MQRSNAEKTLLVPIYESPTPYKSLPSQGPSGTPLRVIPPYAIGRQESIWERYSLLEYVLGGLALLGLAMCYQATRLSLWNTPVTRRRLPLFLVKPCDPSHDMNAEPISLLEQRPDHHPLTARITTQMANADRPG